MNKLLELSEITLIPNSKTENYSNRNQVNYLVRDMNEYSEFYSLPIFTSPMDSIVNISNWRMWQDAGIRSILPRVIPLDARLDACKYIFSAFSIKEVKEQFIDKDRRSENCQYHISIDSGNGHDTILMDLCNRVSRMYGYQVNLMVGNIANPVTYEHYFKAGVDYVRLGISSGSLVDKNKFGFHYPMASLLIDTIAYRKNKNLVKNFKGRETKLIADGGILNISDVLKALALGADYVMMGRGLINIVESSGPIYKKDKSKFVEVTDKDYINTLSQLNFDISKENLYRRYVGNTSMEIQALRSGFDDIDSWIKKEGIKSKISDTVSEWVQITTNINSWILETKEIINYGFMMSDSRSWEEFKKNIIYGRI